MRLHITLALVLLIGRATPAGAQVWPPYPLTFADGRLVIGGEASAAISSDDPGYYNFTDYDHNALRLFRASVSGSFRATRWLTILGELRTENLERPRVFGLYARLTPWPAAPVAIQVGRIPPVFGGYLRRGYTGDPLIGYPLGYQYLTTVRYDAVPATVQDLLAMKGRGWYVTYPLGNTERDHGLPLVTAARWDTGVEVTVGRDPVQVSAALTTGTLSNPRVRDNNGGKQIATRVAWTPTAAIAIGVSGARGEYLADSVTDQVASLRGGNFAQTAFGIDVELSKAYWVVRAEAIFSRWQLPIPAAPGEEDPLGAASVLVEGRYKLTPRFYLAARADRLTFSKIAYDSSSSPDPSDDYGRLYGSWDAPVTRVEAGGGYYLFRNVIAKASYQHNRRQAWGHGRAHLVSAQIFFWF